MIRSAILGGPDDCYRYELRRTWDATLLTLVVCMLNPSTADHERDDPTLSALIHFATAWGYGGLLIVNLFAWRSSSPAAMRACEDARGPDNARHLNAAIEHARDHGGGRLLAAWGNDGALETVTYDAQDEWFCHRVRHAGVDLICLGTTSLWRPKHPMARGRHRIPRDQQAVMWRTAALTDLAA